MEIEEYINTLVYGFSNFGAYDIGVGLEEIFLGNHKKFFEIGFFREGRYDGY